MKYKYIKFQKIVFCFITSTICLLCVGFSLLFFFKDSKNQVRNFAEVNNITYDNNSLLNNDKTFLENNSYLNKNKPDIKQNKKEIKSISKSEVLNYDFSEWNRKHPELIVINNNNSLPDNFEVKTVTLGDQEIGKNMFESLKTMFNDALKDGYKMYVVSGYRNIKLQTKLFNNQINYEMRNNKKINKEEAAEIASKSVARPRHSEHNAGLAADINSVNSDFANTKTYKWLEENAHKYGCIVRYPKESTDETGVIFEPWHIRYVGKDYAEKIHKSGKTLERYIIENEILNNK